MQIKKDIFSGGEAIPGPQNSPVFSPPLMVLPAIRVEDQASIPHPRTPSHESCHDAGVFRSSMTRKRPGA